MVEILLNRENKPVFAGNGLTQLRLHHRNNDTSLAFIPHNTLEQIRPTANRTASGNTQSAIKFNPTENVAQAWRTDK